MRYLFLIACLFFFQSIRAQNPGQRFTLSGVVGDAKTGETIIGAVVQVAENKLYGATSNEYGFYSITMPAGSYTIYFSYSGYNTITRQVQLSTNQTLDISLDKISKELTEVVVTGEAKNAHVTRAQTGMEKLEIATIKDIPVIFGEKDVLKTIQLLPGVKSGGDGQSGFFVRGGTADQNLILLDEAPVYNASHLLGFFSTFNSDAIKNVTLYKGNPPAQFGGRLASVLDIKMNEGNNQNFGFSGGIGTISTKLTAEGPITKNKGSFLVTGRRTYADVFLKISSDTSVRNSNLYFYDFNAKANYELGKKDQLYLSGYFGKDVIGIGETFGINWGNTTATLRWNHIFNQKLFSNTSLIYSKYNYIISIKSGNSDFDIISRIQDFNIKQEFQYFPNPRNSIRMGVNAIAHTITPGEIKATETSGINNIELQKRKAWENAAWIQNDQRVSEKLNLSYGLRLTGFSVMGGSDYYTFNSQGEVLDTLRYASGKVVKTYWNLEPRLTASYILSEIHSIKAAYSRNVQNLHLLTNSTASSPTDRWIASTNNIKPEISDQIALGYYRNMKDNAYEFSVESYYKAMQNQIDYKDYVQIEGNDLVEGQLLSGKGRAYGVEFLLRKKKGKLTGWIGYTFSRTERQIDGINRGQWYAARQDRTHDISVVAIYQVSPKWTLSGAWVYYTGNAVTFPIGKYSIDDKVYFRYGDRNADRMPAYHRLDLGATLKFRDKKRWSDELVFSLYNAYGRQNAYFIEFRENKDNPNITEAEQVALFRWVPSISYNFKFK